MYRLILILFFIGTQNVQGADTDIVTKRDLNDRLSYIENDLEILTNTTPQDRTVARLNSLWPTVPSTLEKLLNQVTEARLSIVRGEGTLESLAKTVKEDHAKTGANSDGISELDKRTEVLETNHSTIEKKVNNLENINWWVVGAIGTAILAFLTDYAIKIFKKQGD